MTPEIIETMERAIRERVPGVLCTVVAKNGSTPCRVGSKMWVEKNGTTIGTVGGGALERETISKAQKLLSDGRPHEMMEYRLEAEPSDTEGLICGGSTAVFMEAIGRRRDLVIFGAGHVGRAVGTIASLCGYSVIFWDDRDGITAPSGCSRFVDLPLEEAIDTLPMEPGVSVVICTWAHGKDGDVVKLLNGKNPSYVGMLSSKKKAATLWETLEKKGVSKEHLERIHTPIGLEIGAGSPQEIAVAIMAEIISNDSGKSSSGCPSAI